MQSVTVNYQQHDSTALQNWFRKRGQFWPNLLLPGIPVVTALPLLIGVAWQQQWLSLAMIVGLVGYFLAMLRAAQRQNGAAIAAKLPTSTFTLFPEGFQVDLERGSWSRRAWTEVEQLVSLDSGLVIAIRESGRELLYEVPRAAFASLVEYEAWVAQAQRWQQEATAKKRVLAPAQLSLTERFRTVQTLTYEELQIWLAYLKLSEEFPHTLPQTAPTDKLPTPKGRDVRLVIFFLATIILVLYDPTASKPREPGLMLGLLMLSLGLLIVCIKVTSWIVDRTERTKYVADEPTTEIFAEEGILKRARHHEHFRSWLDVDALTVHQERLLLWSHGLNCGIFPQRTFATAEEAVAAEEWMRSKIPSQDEDLAQAEFAAEHPTPQIPDTDNPYQAPQTK